MYCHFKPRIILIYGFFYETQELLKGLLKQYLWNVFLCSDFEKYIFLLYSYFFFSYKIYLS